MKLLLKYILYTLLIVVLVSATILLYRTHPEAQLAFILPGLFILVFSRMSDDLKFRTFFPRWTKEK
ncbi:hypothetical protein JN11_03540 [Mucilaginibacter frigoritolerans]|uniref:Uncharacterized protein n=1 Tax=Mucilaginibacter frigoritolerans TaxID=652788 RepID=A0A562TW92_9SPHI|nr:hypothetical protein [Mucilaginibacter frigoritolerans]TWI97080.1 hypothetical protein JN11_03540 [Mucilaginibacter frigoritolerans]